MPPVEHNQVTSRTLHGVEYGEKVCYGETATTSDVVHPDREVHFFFIIPAGHGDIAMAKSWKVMCLSPFTSKARNSSCCMTGWLTPKTNINEWKSVSLMTPEGTSAAN